MREREKEKDIYLYRITLSVQLNIAFPSFKIYYLQTLYLKTAIRERAIERERAENYIKYAF